MKAFIFLCFTIIGGLSLYSCNYKNSENSEQTSTVNQDSIYSAILIKHLRKNFDDIHDVSMRYHHLDHTLNGIIRISMHWENGKLTEASISENQTHNQKFGEDLIEKIKKWEIKDLTGPYQITLPLRIQIVGSNDPAFKEKGIFTGEVFSANGKPVHRAIVKFHSLTNPMDTIRNTFTNREGIFVKTMIPIGIWNIEFSAEGYKTYELKNITFTKGDHLRKKIVLQKK